MKSKIGKSLCVLIAVCAANALPAARAAAETAEKIELKAKNAVIMALDNNKSLQIQSLAPAISKLKEDSAKAAFDPALSTGISTSNSESPAGSKSRSASVSADLSKKLKSGSTVTLDLSTANSNSRSEDSLYGTQFSISLRKPLLNGAGQDVNLASIRQSEISTKTAKYQLQAYSESLIESIVEAYWNYALACRKIQIYEDSLKLAERQMDETKTMIEVGKTAEVELVSAQAEVASRKQALVNIRGNRDKLRIQLLRLVNPSGTKDFWNTEIAVTDDFVMPKVELGDLETHVSTALKMRPDLNEAKLSAESGDIDVVKTRNGLLPYLSFYITLGKSEYADSFPSSYGGLMGDGSSAQIGFDYSVNIGRRAAKSSYEQSLISQQQAGIAIENMEMTVQEDMRSAWIEIDRSANQLDASRATLKLQEEKLRTEEEKYRVGRATSLDVATTQRDLLQSQLDESQAIADYIIAVEKLKLEEGTLLGSYGITIK